MEAEKRLIVKKKYHKPSLTEYGDVLELTESSGFKEAADGGGGYTKTKTA